MVLLVRPPCLLQLTQHEDEGEEQTDDKRVKVGEDPKKNSTLWVDKTPKSQTKGKKTARVSKSKVHSNDLFR
jgi:hypothetical protein